MNLRVIIMARYTNHSIDQNTMVVINFHDYLQPGKSTSQIAVTDVSPDGVWLLASDEELFMPFIEFSWFKKAPIEQILNVVEESPGNYHRPGLDVDLSLKSIRNPEAYPLKTRA